MYFKSIISCSVRGDLQQARWSTRENKSDSILQLRLDIRKPRVTFSRPPTREGWNWEEISQLPDWAAAIRRSFVTSLWKGNISPRGASLPLCRNDSFHSHCGKYWLCYSSLHAVEIKQEAVFSEREGSNPQHPLEVRPKGGPASQGSHGALGF